MIHVLFCCVEVLLKCMFFSQSERERERETGETVHVNRRVCASVTSRPAHLIFQSFFLKNKTPYVNPDDPDLTPFSATTGLFRYPTPH